MNYYRVADLLGEGSKASLSVDPYRFPHSLSSFGIRASFRESKISYSLVLAKLMSFGNFLGNSMIDHKKASNVVSDLYSALCCSIPYLNGSRAGSGGSSGRKEFVDEFWKLHGKAHAGNTEK